MEAAPTILVVDDDADIRDAMCLILEHNGYRATAASNGEEALRVLRAGRPVDLILLDMMMPVMDGWGFRTSQPDGPALGLAHSAAPRHGRRAGLGTDARDLA